MTTMKPHWLRRVPKIVVIVIVIAAVMAFVVMSLWNWIVPGLFGLPVLTFWQALGLLLLCKLLFGGFARGFHGRGGHWRERMMERWVEMTPEERERFMRGLECGKRGGAPGEAANG